jgi:hypothetical protein
MTTVLGSNNNNGNEIAVAEAAATATVFTEENENKKVIVSKRYVQELEHFKKDYEITLTMYKKYPEMIDTRDQVIEGLRKELEEVKLQNKCENDKLVSEKIKLGVEIDEMKALPKSYKLERKKIKIVTQDLVNMVNKLNTYPSEFYITIDDNDKIVELTPAL